MIVQPCRDMSGGTVMYGHTISYNESSYKWPLFEVDFGGRGEGLMMGWRIFKCVQMSCFEAMISSAWCDIFFCFNNNKRQETLTIKKTYYFSITSCAHSMYFTLLPSSTCFPEFDVIILILYRKRIHWEFVSYNNSLQHC